jgi:large subunit ribosomal protein L9
MKVLLCQDVEKLGWLGDVVEVSVGYARNFLLPQRLAIEATKKNVESLAEAKAQRAEQRRLEREHVEAAAKAVNGAQIVISAKANEQGHLFGSVSAHDVAENLRSQGFEVHDDVIKMSDNIKEVGTYDINLKYASDVTASVKVVVVSQDEAVESSEQQTS